MKKYWIILLVYVVISQIFIIQMVSKFDGSGKNNDNIIINQVNGYATDISDEIENVEKQLVTINSQGFLTTGVIYSYQDNVATIITSNLTDLDDISVTFNNGESFVPYEIYTTDNNIQILYVILPFKVTPIPLADSNNIKQGEFIIAVQQNDDLFLNTNAYVSYLNQTKVFSNNTIIATTNTEQALKSAPVLNMNGELIGFITNNTTVTNDLEFITVNYLKILLNSKLYINTLPDLKIDLVELNTLESYKKLSHQINLSINYGLYIHKINTNNSIFKTNDIIVEINDVPVNTIEEYLTNINNTNVLKFTVLRNNVTLEIEYSLND